MGFVGFMEWMCVGRVFFVRFCSRVLSVEFL